MTTPFNDLYKEFRNRLRRFSPTSIVYSAIRTLRSKTSPGIEQLRLMPWQTLLLVKWALQDRLCDDKLGRAISSREFDTLRQQMHNLADRMSLGPGGFKLKMRRLINPQIVFQRRFSPGFVRELAILDSLDPQHTLRNEFRDRVGMEPQLFIDFGFAASSQVLDDRPTIPSGWFAPLANHHGKEMVGHFVKSVSADVTELTRYVRALQTGPLKAASEYFEVTPLRRYPFVQIRGALESWHPMIFYRGMEEIVHLTMTSAGSDYMQPFSKLFEKHSIGEVANVRASFYDEQQLRQILGNQEKVPDALLNFPSANIFVESKAGLFDDAFMALGDPEILHSKTKPIRDAIRQGWNASMRIRSSGSAPGPLRNAPWDYLLIVTNREIALGSGKDLISLYPTVRAEELAHQASAYLPPEHVFIISIDDLERVMAAARHGELDLPAFLGRCVDRDSRPESAKYYFDQHLTEERVKYGWSDLVQNALDESEGRLTQILRVNQQ